MALVPMQQARLDLSLSTKKTCKHELLQQMVHQMEKIKTCIGAKVEYPFRVIKRQFGYAMARYRGLKKNTLQLRTLFVLSNLWMVRHALMGV